MKKNTSQGDCTLAVLGGRFANIRETVVVLWLHCGSMRTVSYTGGCTAAIRVTVPLLAAPQNSA